jgi:hypothetical protein
MPALTARFPVSFRTLLLLNGMWLLIYFIVFAVLPQPVSDSVLFSAPDAQQYLSTSTEFYDFSQTGASDVRPFLYPLLIRIVHGAGGAWALWFVQLLCWLGSANFIFLALQRATQKNMFAVAGSLVYALNLSAIVITLHGLTETVTIFLLSGLLYVIAARDPQQPLRTMHRVLFLLVLLTTVKPLFYIPLLLVLAVLPFVALRYYRQQPRRLLILVVLLLPLVYQLTLMKVKYNTVTVSHITDKTVRNYLLTQGLQQTGGGTWDEAMAKAQAMPPDSVRMHLLSHKKMYASLMYENLHGNIASNATYLLFPAQYEHPFFATCMKNMNTVYYYLHLLFVLPWLLALYLSRRSRNRDAWLLLAVAGLLNFYILGTSAISFWQGDRLVLPALPVFAVLYPFTVYLLYRGWKTGFKKGTL